MPQFANERKAGVAAASQRSAAQQAAVLRATYASSYDRFPGVRLQMLIGLTPSCFDAVDARDGRAR